MSSPSVDTDITIQTYNTITLAGGSVYTLTTPYCGAYYFNILNLGPCTLYIASGTDPAVGDPNSMVLPPGCADNMILVPDGTVGLKVLAGEPCGCCYLGPPGGAANPCAVLSVRLVRG